MGPRHERVRRLRRLAQQRSARRREGAFVAEGAKLVAAALDAGVDVEAVYVAPEAEKTPGASEVVERARGAGVRVFELAAGVIDRVADATTPQPLVAVVRSGTVTLDHVFDSALVFVLIDVRDPGNLGAILRVADASGAGGVVCAEGTADAYNPKTVRASAGSVFSVPLVVGGEPGENLASLRGRGFRLVGTAARGGIDYAEATFGERTALVLGNEASGIDADVTAALDEIVTVPMAGATESLNVATAAAVLAFELLRRRRAASNDAVR